MPEQVWAARVQQNSVGSTSPSRQNEERLVASEFRSKSGCVLVTHPGLQHSHQLAQALHEKGLLQAFWSGIPVVDQGEPPPWWLPNAYRRRVRQVEIPAALRRHPVQFQIMLRAGIHLGAGAQNGDAIHRIFHRFDAWAASRLPALRPRAVVAYENAAYHTFTAAKAAGALCILDAAAFHHKTVAALVSPSDTAYTAEINRRKDEEIAMADLILTCSPVAADSYAANGIDRRRLKSLLLGADPAPGLPRREATNQGVPRFIFAGPLSRRKAVDLLLAAFRRLHSEGVTCELHCVGGVSEPDLLEAIHQTPNARYFASVPQPELFQMIGEADCLVLPSRSDSFGMVVAEAMSCGTPALVSTQTGAKAIVEAFPGSGWIVEPDANALYLELRRLIADREILQRARLPALEASREFSWANYRKRAGNLLEQFLQ